MTATVWTDVSAGSSMAENTLKLAARFWFLVAVAGQWIFVAYVLAFYGGSALRGDLEAWTRVGYVPGHTASNSAPVIHLLLAVVIMIGGPLQLIPSLRRRLPAFHRWNGRIYLPAVAVTALAGLFMIWSMGRGGSSLVPRVGISIDAVLIVTFAVLTLRRALARDLGAHRRWALRLFMVVNAGWFFRIGLMEWIFLNHGPAGFDAKTFTGPFINFLSFADYLLPLLLLELYLLAKQRGSASGRFSTAAALLVVTAGMGVGIFGATVGMWIPHMKPPAVTAAQALPPNARGAAR
jgi:hypothetical protein